MKILITSGGTQVPIDPVRFISNHSTGKTGSFLTDELLKAGHEVHLFSAVGALKPQYTQAYKTFTTFEDFERGLTELLRFKQYDWIIHLAALSDFTTDGQSQKISSGKELHLKLVPTPKLVNTIKMISPESRLVAFKLTTTKNKAEQFNKVEKLLKDSQADFVVHNCLDEVDENKHVFEIWNNKMQIKGTGENKEAMAELIVNILGSTL